MLHAHVIPLSPMTLGADVPSSSGTTLGGYHLHTPVRSRVTHEPEGPPGWSGHGDVRPALLLGKQESRYLELGRMEQVPGIEPSSPTWKDGASPTMLHLHVGGPQRACHAPPVGFSDRLLRYAFRTARGGHPVLPTLVEYPGIEPGGPSLPEMVATHARTPTMMIFGCQ